MHDQGITPLLITPADLSPLDLLADPPAHAIAALNEGQPVLIPAQPVLLDGVVQWGWWEIDPTSGETIGVLENSLHSALTEYKFWISYLNNLSKWPRRYQKAVKKLWNYVVANVVPALGGFAPEQTAND